MTVCEEVWVEIIDEKEGNQAYWRPRRHEEGDDSHLSCVCMTGEMKTEFSAQTITEKTSQSWLISL